MLSAIFLSNFKKCKLANTLLTLSLLKLIKMKIVQTPNILNKSSCDCKVILHSGRYFGEIVLEWWKLSKLYHAHW